MTEETTTPTTTETPPVVEVPKAETPVVETKAETKTETVVDPPKTTETTKPVVPEKYDLKIPEGSQLDASRLEKISSYAKEKGLSNEAAQDILNREHEAVMSHMAMANSKVETLNKTTWFNELKADKEFGGDKLEENGKLAFKAADTFFGPEFGDFLRKQNLNHNPMVFKGLVRIAKAMANDKLVNGNLQGGRPRRPEDVLYNNQQYNQE